MVLSVLDLGSNSFHLAAYRVRSGGRLERVERRKEMCRLGAGTLWDGQIDDAAWRRGAAALDRLYRRAVGGDPDRLIAVATSAIREAGNGGEFCRAARRRLGLEIEVLSGEEEAHLVYWGARSALRGVGRIGVIDVGGGSVQIAVGDRRSCGAAACLPLGVLRLRDLAPDLVAPHVAGTAREAMSRVRALRPEALVMTGGTARRLAAVALGLGLRRPSERSLSRAALAAMAAALPELRPSELDALGVEEARRDTILHGALVFDALLALGGADSALVSSRGLREGVALRELGRIGRRTGRARRAFGVGVG